MSRSAETFNTLLQTAINEKDPGKALVAFQTKVLVANQTRETAMGAKGRHPKHLPYFINELNEAPYNNGVPLVCYIARSLYYEGNSWNIVMAAALYIGADPEAYDPESEKTAKQMIIESGKGADVLEKLNKTYLPQLSGEPVLVVWPELMTELSLEANFIEKEDGSSEDEEKAEGDKKITVPAFGITENTKPTTVPAFGGGGAGRGPNFQFAREGNARQKLLDPTQEKDAGCWDNMCVMM